MKLFLKNLNMEFLGRLFMSSVMPGVRLLTVFLLTFALTRFLVVSEYGQWVVFLSFINTVVTFTSFMLMAVG